MEKRWLLNLCEFKALVEKKLQKQQKNAEIAKSLKHLSAHSSNKERKKATSAKLVIRN